MGSGSSLGTAALDTEDATRDTEERAVCVDRVEARDRAEELERRLGRMLPFPLRPHSRRRRRRPHLAASELLALTSCLFAWAARMCSTACPHCEFRWHQHDLGILRVTTFLMWRSLVTCGFSVLSMGRGMIMRWDFIFSSVQAFAAFLLQQQNL